MRQKVSVEMRGEVYVIAFEDAELNVWLIQAIEEGPGQFLPALRKPW